MSYDTAENCQMYYSLTVPSETTPDDMTTKATGSRVDQSQTHSFATGIQGIHQLFVGVTGQGSSVK